MAEVNDGGDARPAAPGGALAHMPAIDGLRGVAILLVLVHHFTPPVGGSPIVHRLLDVAHTGWIGVDLFLVLSGFLITSILLKTRHRPGYFTNFYARRTLRIFPLYYAVLVGLLVVLPAAMGLPAVRGVAAQWFGEVTRELPRMLDGQAWLWLYGSNLKVALTGERWGPVNHFWSLAVEEQFYLAWPLVVYFASPAGLKRVCVALIVASPVLRGGLLLAGADSVVPYVLTVCRVDALAMGGLLAAVMAEPGGLGTWAPRVRWAGVAAAVALGVTYVLSNRLHRDDPFTSVVGFSLLAVVSTWLVLAAARVRPGTRVCGLVANPVLTSFGKYSYGLYVTHMFFVPAYAMLFPRATLEAWTGSTIAAIAIHAALAIGCSWGIAWVCFHAFERHFLRMKDLFRYETAARETVRREEREAEPAVFARTLRRAA